VQAPSSHGQVGEQQEQQQHQGKQKDAASSSSTQGAASDGRASDQRSVEHVEGSLSSRRAEGGRQAPAGQAAPPPALAPEVSRAPTRGGKDSIALLLSQKPLCVCRLCVHKHFVCCACFRMKSSCSKLVPVYAPVHPITAILVHHLCISSPCMTPRAACCTVVASCYFHSCAQGATTASHSRALPLLSPSA
jgi:hypothetical protein